MKKWLLLLLVPTLFTGCLGGDGQPELPAASEKKSLISVVAPEYSMATKPYFEQLVKDFRLRYPHIEVELQVMNWDILVSAYNSMISRNQPPDLLLTNNYAHFAKDGLLNHMDELISSELKGKIYDYYSDNSHMNGVRYAVPYVATTRELYYNKDIFDEIGLKEPPKTWTELEEMSRTIKGQMKVESFGVDFSDNEIWAYLSYFFFGAGGGWMKDGKWAIHSPENVEGLTFLKKLYDQGLTDAEPTVTTRDEKQRILGNGKLAMLISGNYFEAVVPREYPGLKWAKGPIPVKGGQDPFVFGVHDIWISFKTDHTDKAAISQFLEFLYNDSRYEEFIIRERFLPTLQTVGQKLSIIDPSINRDLELIKNAKFYPIHAPAWSSVLEATRNMGQAVMLGNMAPKEALDQLQQLALRKTK